MLARCSSTLFQQGVSTPHSCYHASNPSLDVSLLDNMHAESKTLLGKVIRSQRNAGYNPDHWRTIQLGELTHPHLLQSLAHGEKSLCRVNRLEWKNFKNLSLPDGASPFFSTMCAFSKHGRIHPQSPGTPDDDHFAAATQTRPHTIFGYREHLGIFSVKQLLSRHRELSSLMVVIADVKANPAYGQSESRQIVVPHLLLPLIHMCCKRIITQSNHYGVSKVQSSINPQTGVIEWNFDGETLRSNSHQEPICLPPPRWKK